MTRKEEEEYDEQIPRRLRGGGMHVLVRNDDVEQAIRKLSRAERDEGIAREFKKREYYLKPSAQRRFRQEGARAPAVEARDAQEAQLDRPQESERLLAIALDESF